MKRFLAASVMLILVSSTVALAQAGAAKKSDSAIPVATLEHDFFAAIRDGDAKKFLSYVPQQGVNLGTPGQRASRDEIEKQMDGHRGLYCKLFDSSCIDSPINLENSARACSYRELLTHSEKASTAGSEMTRNGVQQAVLVARIKNDQCSNSKLIDFIFNLDADGWKLFSIP